MIPCPPIGEDIINILLKIVLNLWDRFRIQLDGVQGLQNFKANRERKTYGISSIVYFGFRKTSERSVFQITHSFSSSRKFVGLNQLNIPTIPNLVNPDTDTASPDRLSFQFHGYSLTC